MARLNARWSRFWATSKTYKHFWQSFPVIGSGPGAIVTVTTTISTAGLVNVSALGSTLTDTITLIGGHANVSANGVTLTDTTSIISGTVNVTATGATITDTTSLIDGLATGGALASGVTITATVSLIAGVASVVQPGATLTVSTSVLEGHADVTTDGATVSIDLTLSDEGVANVSAEGDTLEIDLTLIDGVATVDAHIVGAVLEVDLFLAPGVASELAPGTAEGATVTVGVNVIAGRAEGGFVRVTGGMPYGPSTPQRVQVVNATAQGATITLLAFALPGVATGTDAKHKVVRAAPVVTEIVPISRVHVTASGQQVVRQLMIEAGKASGDAIAYGQLVEGQRDWGPYDDDVLMLVLA